jgi:tellurite resistance protein TehA-like permease
MSRREVGFLLIGLGIGLLLAVVGVVELVYSFHHMFIIGISWTPGSLLLLLPFGLVGCGVTHLFRSQVRLNEDR